MDYINSHQRRYLAKLNDETKEIEVYRQDSDETGDALEKAFFNAFFSLIIGFGLAASIDTIYPPFNDLILCVISIATISFIFKGIFSDIDSYIPVEKPSNLTQDEWDKIVLNMINNTKQNSKGEYWFKSRDCFAMNNIINIKQVKKMNKLERKSQQLAQTNAHVKQLQNNDVIISQKLKNNNILLTHNVAKQITANNDAIIEKDEALQDACTILKSHFIADSLMVNVIDNISENCVNNKDKKTVIELSEMLDNGVDKYDVITKTNEVDSDNYNEAVKDFNILVANTKTVLKELNDVINSDSSMFLKTNNNYMKSKYYLQNG